MKELTLILLSTVFIFSGFNQFSYTIAAETENNYTEEEFEIPDQFRNRILPPKADNRTKYLRKPFEHLGHPCAFAASISYNFTYEVNLLRGLASNTDDTQYPYTYGYHFYNNGNQSASVADFVQGYLLLLATGVPTNTAMGGFTEGYPTKWLNGYEKYYKAMQNRIKGYHYFDCKTKQGFEDLKQWVYDHAGSTDRGGLANFNVASMGIKVKKVSSGAAMGKSIIVGFGTNKYDHSLTIVGYDDSVGYDYNNDGKITNDIDITNDGVVDIRDYEMGAFIIVNSHIVWDDGFAYASYRLFALDRSKNGIGRDNKVYGIQTLKEYKPRYTLKTTITSSSRNKLKIYAGIAPDINATKPTKVKSFAGAFNYAGGAYPMEGKNGSSRIEIGLDVTDLVDSVNKETGAFFLCIDVKGTGSYGTINTLSLIDYTGAAPAEFKYDKQDISISGTMTLGGLAPVTSVKHDITMSAEALLTIKPNPVQLGKSFSLSIPYPDYSCVLIQLYDVSGRLILQKKVYHSKKRIVDIATSNLATGMYYIVLTSWKTNGRMIGRCHEQVIITK